MFSSLRPDLLVFKSLTLDYSSHLKSSMLELKMIFNFFVNNPVKMDEFIVSVKCVKKITTLSCNFVQLRYIENIDNRQQRFATNWEALSSAIFCVVNILKRIINSLFTQF